MHIENMEATDVFEHLAENCDRNMLLAFCEEHIDQTEYDDELADFITYILKHREDVKLLVSKALGGGKI